jgi:hypothetical protein
VDKGENRDTKLAIELFPLGKLGATMQALALAFLFLKAPAVYQRN